MSATPIMERTLDTVQGGSRIAITVDGTRYEGVIRALRFGLIDGSRGVQLRDDEGADHDIDGPKDTPVEVLAYRPHEYISSPQRVCKTCGVAKRHHGPMEAEQ